MPNPNLKHNRNQHPTMKPKAIKPCTSPLDSKDENDDSGLWLREGCGVGGSVLLSSGLGIASNSGSYASAFHLRSVGSHLYYVDTFPACRQSICAWDGVCPGMGSEQRLIVNQFVGNNRDLQWNQQRGNHSKVLAASAAAPWKANGLDQSNLGNWAGKRKYLADRKGFFSYLGMKPLLRTALAASIKALYPMYMRMLQELKQDMLEDESDEDEEDSEEEEEEDSDDEEEEEELETKPVDFWALYSEFYERFVPAMCRLLSTQTITKYLDLFCVKVCSARMADRLTKDVSLSLKRKKWQQYHKGKGYNFVNTLDFQQALIKTENLLYATGVSIIASNVGYIIGSLMLPGLGSNACSVAMDNVCLAGFEWLLDV